MNLIDENSRSLVKVHVTEEMIKQVKKSKKKMVKMEAKGLEYGVAQKPLTFAVPKIKIQLTQQQLETKKADWKLKKEIKLELIAQSQALVAEKTSDPGEKSLNQSQHHSQNSQSFKPFFSSQNSNDFKPENQKISQVQGHEMLRKRQPESSKLEELEELNEDLEEEYSQQKSTNQCNLPQFLRTATTNLRYSQENRMSASQEIDDPRKMTQTLLYGKHTLLKSFSYDVGAMAQDIIKENGRMKFIQAVRMIYLHFQNMNGLNQGALQSLDLQIDSQSSINNSDNLEMSQNLAEISMEDDGFGNLISKSKQKMILTQFQQMESVLLDVISKEQLKEQSLGAQSVYLNLFYNIDLLYFFNVIKKMQVFLRFMLTTSQKDLFKLRKKLYFDDFSHEERYFAHDADLCLEKILNGLAPYFSHDIQDMYLRSVRDSCLIILEHFQISFQAIMQEFNALEKLRILKDEEMSKMSNEAGSCTSLKFPGQEAEGVQLSEDCNKKVNQLRSSVAFELLVDYIRTLSKPHSKFHEVSNSTGKEAKSAHSGLVHLNPVFKSLFRMIQLSHKLTLSKNQPKIVTEFNKIFDDQVLVSNKLWVMFVEAYTTFFKTDRPELIAVIEARPELIASCLKKSAKKKTGLDKALNIAITRCFIDNHIVPRLLSPADDHPSLEPTVIKIIDGFVADPSQQPYLVYLIQQIQEKQPSMKCLKISELSQLSNFIRTYLTVDAEQELSNAQFTVDELERYLRLKGELLDIIAENKAENLREILEVFSEQTLKNLNAIKKKTAVDRQSISVIKEQAEERKLTKYMFYMILVNQCYIMRASKSPSVQGAAGDIQRFFEGAKVREILTQCLTPQEKRLLNQIVSNFKGIPALQVDSDGLQIENLYAKILLAHNFILFLCCGNTILKPSSEFTVSKRTDSGQDKFLYTRRVQLGYVAPPDSEGSKYSFLASLVMAPSLQSKINDVTSLNQCSCGYFYFIGNCGMANQTSNCQSCNRPIGGQHHQLNQGNRKVELADFIKVYEQNELEHLDYMERHPKKVAGSFDQKVDDPDSDDENQKTKLTRRKSRKTVSLQQNQQPKIVMNLSHGVFKDIKIWESVRAIAEEKNFRIVDMIGHARYLFEYVMVSDDGLVTELNEFFGKQNQAEATEYLFEIFEGYFAYFSGENQRKTPLNAYNMLNIFTEQNLTELILPRENRNQLENDIPLNFEELESTFTQIQALKNQLRNRLSPKDGSGVAKQKAQISKSAVKTVDRATANHIVNWISKTISLEELRDLNPEMDFKVVRCLKSPAKPLSLSELIRCIELDLKKGFRDFRQQNEKVKEEEQNDGGSSMSQERKATVPQLIDMIEAKVEEDQMVDEPAPQNQQQQAAEVENSDLQIDTVNLQFLHYVITNFDLLSKYRSLLLAHVELVSYIKQKFEYKISYQLACSLSIFDLTTNHTPNVPSIQNLQLPNDPTDEELAEYEAYDLLLQRANFVQKYGKDSHLEERFYALYAAWDYINQVRDKYPTVFDFRFLCHANALPEEQIREITTVHTAKLIYFMPSDKYVESLFISSALQTLGRYQNYLIKTFAPLYKMTNLEEPTPISPLQLTRLQKRDPADEPRQQIITVPSPEELIEHANLSSFVGPEFNSNGKRILNYPNLVQLIVPGIFKNRPELIFEGDYFYNFNFSGSVGEVSEAVSTISQMIPQKELSKFCYKKLLAGLIDGQQSVMGIFAIFAKKVEFWRGQNQGVKGYLEKLRAKLSSSGQTDSDALGKAEIQFFEDEDHEEKNETTQGIPETAEDLFVKKNYKRKHLEASNLLNSCRITYSNLREAWELIEDHMYEHSIPNLDVIFKQDLSIQNLRRVKAAAASMSEEETDSLLRVCKSILLRQLIGSTRHNIAQLGLKDCLEWSDALHEDEEINPKLLEALSEFDEAAGESEIQMCHLFSLINNIQ